MPQLTEEQIIQRYFDAFNRHDLDGVMACFHDEPLLITWKVGNTAADGRSETLRVPICRFPR